MAYRPDGGRLAALCGGGELLIFDSQTGRELGALASRTTPNPPATGSTTARSASAPTVGAS